MASAGETLLVDPTLDAENHSQVEQDDMPVE
jgi:hypothetical protein